MPNINDTPLKIGTKVPTAIYTASDEPVCIVDSMKERSDDADVARRMVACWNACLGISTEALERQGVRLRDDALIQFKPGGEILGGTREAVEVASAVITQRDDLLAALTALMNDPAVIEAAQPGDIGRALVATREDL